MSKELDSVKFEYKWILFGSIRKSEVINNSGQQVIKNKVEQKSINDVSADFIKNFMYAKAATPVNSHLYFKVEANGFNQMMPIISFYQMLMKVQDDKWPLITDLKIRPIYSEKIDDDILSAEFEIQCADQLPELALLDLLKAKKIQKLA